MTMAVMRTMKYADELVGLSVLEKQNGCAANKKLKSLEILAV